MTHKPKRRFIAGAICPRCASLDTVFVYQQNKLSVRACADCDFEEHADFQQPQQELPTRVNQTVDDSVVEIEKIKIIDNLEGKVESRKSTVKSKSRVDSQESKVKKS